MTLKLVETDPSEKLLLIVTPTHNPSWLSKTWDSMRNQDYKNWRWLIFVNSRAASKSDFESRIDAIERQVGEIVKNAPKDKVAIAVSSTPISSIGQCKLEAFKYAESFYAKGDSRSEVFVELDHDDLLLPGALGKISQAFDDPGIGFVYSDFIDFDSTNEKDVQGFVTYRHPQLRASWEANGWGFYPQKVENAGELDIKDGTYEAAKAFGPSAQALSLVYFAPNHVRAWRRSAYWEAGGHSPAYEVCDDHELLCRTYLTTKMKRISEPLYLYRVSGRNTWASDTEKIKRLTYEIREKYLERLILRECALCELPAYDLGGGISPREGFVPVDVNLAGQNGLKVDLEGPWPFKDNSVGAFRAADLLEHLPDKQHTMHEIWRCLRPGGWLLSLTPSTTGNGAFMDPTHKSYWNELSFWYWTRRAQANYIRNTQVRFQEVKLGTYFPSEWHKTNNISYVMANLIALKDGYEGPGEKRI